MTQEEKARAYDEALKRAKAAMDMAADKDLVGGVVRTILPQLAESEDERIRKEIISAILSGRVYDTDLIGAGHIFQLDKEVADKWIAYLEKQKERGPLTKEEEYILHRIIEYLEDETCPSEWISLLHDIYCLPYEKQKEPRYTKRNALFDKCVENCDPEIMQRVSDEVDEMLEKEQKSEGWSEEFEKNIRELLYNKLRWDSEDGRISTAVFIDDKTLKDIVTGIWFYVEKEAMKNPNMELPKQEWSNEDEEKLKAICTYLRDYSRLAKINDVKRFNAYCDWLKLLSLNLKKENEDVEKLCSNEWSKEDEEMLVRLLDSISIGNNYEEMRNWLLPKLKSLRQQSKREWSEEDERIRNQLIYDVEHYKKEGLISAKQNKATKTLYDGIEKCYDEKIAWLKSLRSQSHWKPSKEQMKALNALNLYGSLSYVGQQNQLISLSQDLEKL